MATKAQAFKLAEKLGATIDYNYFGLGEFDATVFAPRGMTWACSDAHCFVNNNQCAVDPNTSDFWKGLIEEMQSGLDDCTATDCDICAEF